MVAKLQAAERAICQDEESINWKWCVLCQSDAHKEKLVPMQTLTSEFWT